MKIHLTRVKPDPIKIDPFIRFLNSNIPTERIPTPEKVSVLKIKNDVKK